MKSRHRKRLEKKNSKGDRISGITLFLVIVIIAVGSVWYGLMPADQQLQTTGAYGLPVGDPTLTTCVSSSNVLLKLKVNLRIILNGTQIVIPAKIGVATACIRPLHTLDNSGDVYVDSPVYYAYTLKDFFAVWGQVFTNDQIFTLHASTNHKITMTVNRQPNLDFENHVLTDGDQIVITFT